MRKYIYLGISLCMLLTAVFAVRFIYDVLKAAWCACRGKDIRWKVFEIFTDNDDWKSILIWGVIVCVGVYGFFQANTDMVRAKYEVAETQSYSKEPSEEYSESYNEGYRDGYARGVQDRKDEEDLRDEDYDDLLDELLIDGLSIRGLQNRVYEKYGLTPDQAFGIVDEYEYDSTHGGFTWSEYQNAIEAIYYTASIFPKDY